MRIQRLTFAPPGEEDMLGFLTDAELLERFTSGQEDAFALLVRRHGDLVLGVCRRVLQHSQDAEDAFQAAFLVLARKARSIQKGQSLASWLYKVAYRIALRARTAQARRKVLESKIREEREPLAIAGVAADDLGDLLDEEVHRLPEKYRVPVLLCYLQGRTNEEAARQMRCPTGTVKVRLLRARELLRKRLVRRGVALSLSVLLAGCLQRATAAPPSLLASTSRAGVEVAAGGPWAAAGVSAQAAGMAQGALKVMVLARLKVAVAVLLTVLLGAWSDGLSQQARATTPVPGIKSPIPKPAERPLSPSLEEREPSQPPGPKWPYLLASQRGQNPTSRGPDLV